MRCQATNGPAFPAKSNLRAVRDGWRILMVIVREWLCGMRKRDPRRLTAAQATAPVTSGVMGEIAAGSYREHMYVSETSVDHTEVVAAIAADDVTGVSTAYDRYGEGLYTYCRSRLSQPADAADAVQNAFINASAKVSELTQPSRLRAWLFAVARYECYLRLRMPFRRCNGTRRPRQRMIPQHFPLLPRQSPPPSRRNTAPRTRHACRAGNRGPGDQRADPSSWILRRRSRGHSRCAAQPGACAGHAIALAVRKVTGRTAGSQSRTGALSRTGRPP